MPGNLIAATLRAGLYTRIVGRRLLYFQELTSTMDEAARQAEADAGEGTVVVAETQTAGRGRFGRNWVSRQNNLYLSVLFRPDLTALPFLSGMSGVASVRAIAKTAGLKARLKWPNDVTLDGKKVGGILVESAISGDQVRHAIVGIGINVGLDMEDAGEISSFATSLNAAKGDQVSREDLLRRLLHELDAQYVRLTQGETPMDEWRELLDTIGQEISVTWQGDHYTGRAEGVDDIGNLQLRLADNRLITLTSGDVTLRKPDSINGT